MIVIVLIVNTFITPDIKILKPVSHQFTFKYSSRCFSFLGTRDPIFCLLHFELVLPLAGLALYFLLIILVGFTDTTRYISVMTARDLMPSSMLATEDSPPEMGISLLMRREVQIYLEPIARRILFSHCQEARL